MIPFSIDQNCHSLWDVIPKLQALSRHGMKARHFVEDIDVAFAALGAHAGSGRLFLARERYYRGGGADWGAAMFYQPFLAPLSVDVQAWEPYTGMTTAALARRLHCTVDDLYNRHSPGGAWQLIGPSYVDPRGQYHRVIGDLGLAETRDFLHQLMDQARRDMHQTFPARPCRCRIDQWFDDEDALVNDLEHRCSGGTLTDLYRLWLEEKLDGVADVGVTSSLFACGHNLHGRELLELFTTSYERAADIYNRAVHESQVGLHALRVSEGELPLFACLEHDHRQVRVNMHLQDGQLLVGDKRCPLAAGGRLPLESLCEMGVQALAGKAAVLVCQVRAGEGGGPLALPHQGSLYMPAAHLLMRKLRADGLYDRPLAPVMRVRLRLLDRIGGLNQPLHLPPHMAAAFGEDEISCRQFAQGYGPLADEARRRLESFKTPQGRQAWTAEAMPEIGREIEDIERRRRELAARGAPPEELRPLWKTMKELQDKVLIALVEQIAVDWQVRDVGYYDSRGAMLPWAVALGGIEFYNSLLEQAEISLENDDDPPQGEASG
ncbi:MAG: hypothetical protein ABFD92_10270 [Planctomycetaceae bacterium]|nr:hypothetical protein [Planctomycetaceae bacterium]